MTTSIYLDHNATAPILPEVAQAVSEAAQRYPGNPASGHQAGRQARRALEEAREGIAAILGVKTDGTDADTLVFTSGGTEANNLAVRGLAVAAQQLSERSDAPPRAVISAIEHPCLQGAAGALHAAGWHVDVLPVDRSGVVRVEQLPDLLTGQTRLVSVMLGNHETGVLQPVEQIARICSARGIAVHTDAVQVAGKLPVDFRGLGVSAMSLCAHKLHGPVGIGALVVRAGVAVAPLLHGGFQQQGLRPGTESVPLAIGFHRALLLWQEEAQRRQQRMTQLRDRLETDLAAELPEIVVHGAAATRLPHTSCISFGGLDRQQLLLALDCAGVACSTGSACESGSTDPSPVLVAMGLEKGLIDSALRLSLGALTTPQEVDEAVARISKTVNDLRRRK